MKAKFIHKQRIKILLVRPPYYYWPLTPEADSYLLPLGLPCLSAYIKREMQDVEIKIIDCPPNRIGWKTLKGLIISEKPDVIGVGDKVTYINEGIKLLSMAKEINPEVVTVAGGHFHSHMAEYSLNNWSCIDFVVRYEGEETFRDLLETLRRGGNLSTVKSIAFRENGKVVLTEPRPLIEDLDSLPMPDYDGVSMKNYGLFGYFYPKSSTIQGSRGCEHNCKYCSWVALEGDHKLEKGEIVTVPKFRKKSVSRTIEEIDYLYNKFGVRYLIWAEGTWNHDNQWINDLSEEIIKRKYKLNSWAFVRGDLLLEQEKLGILEKMVRAGWCYGLFGAERANDEDLVATGKFDMSADKFKEACLMLERKYPAVFRHGVFITGIRSETKESIDALGKFSRDCHLDFATYHPITPWPGTTLWKEVEHTKLLEEKDFTKYDLFNAIMPSEFLSRSEIEKYTQKLYQDFVKKDPLKYIKALFSPHFMRKKATRWNCFLLARTLIRDFILSTLRGKKPEGLEGLHRLCKPKWYET